MSTRGNLGVSLLRKKLSQPGLTKKVKGIHHANFMDDIAITEKESPWGKAHSRHRLSFKEKLVGELPGAYRRAFDLVD